MIKNKPLPTDIRDRFHNLTHHFRENGRVVALYLFGSSAREQEDRLSDIDLALLLDPETLPVDLFQVQLAYLGEINHILRTDEVSFVLLNDCPLIVQYNVIRTGQILVDNNLQKRLAFERRVEDLYFDFKPYLDAYDAELIRQIKEGIAFGQ